MIDYSQYDTIMLDGLNYAVQYYVNVPTVFRERPTGAIYGLLRLINRILESNESITIIVLFDSYPLIKRMKYDFYKKSRIYTLDDFFWKQINDFKKVIALYPYDVAPAFVSGYEAYDLPMKLFYPKIAKRLGRVLIMSEDKSFFIYSKHADIYADNKIIEKGSARYKKYDFRYMNIIKTFLGEIQDDIPNLVHIKIADFMRFIPKVVKQSRLIEDMYDYRVDENLTFEEFDQKVKENKYMCNPLRMGRETHFYYHSACRQIIRILRRYNLKNAREFLYGG